ncbi:asparagine synthetase B [Halalkalicoccus paucihalophilus]|uniref:Asparagine synthetase B n=2 Tax=Halalkalicoccus paucihalophilus TaxID=1008153 RepID=A0A151AJ39_9EURY|nr:asparagine synthetase B [Halalkalicoccus paucihalophilus]
MVGVLGVTGAVERPTAALLDPLRWDEDETVETTVGDELLVLTATHGPTDDPVRTDGHDAIWTFGEIHGFEGERYENRYDGCYTDSEYTAELYREHGLDFARGMNATASVVLHQRERDRLVVVTDRLGTHPVYYAEIPEGVVFSTSVQTLLGHPDVDPAIDTDGLYSYLAFNRVPGVDTPFEGVSTLPPGSITTIDLPTGDLDVERYWRLEYDPLDRSFSYFVDRFVELLQRVFAERADDDRRYGILLSGGSDSRLLLAAAEGIPVAYHLADWMSREARTAERIALLAGADFRLLKRPDDHVERMLEHVPRHMNFNGRFDQAHLHGFDARIREECDVLVTGLYGDSFFKGGLVPAFDLDLGPIGSVSTPIAREVDSIDGYLDALGGSLPSFVETPPLIESVLRATLNERAGGSVAFGGIEYASLYDLALFGSYYPLSNDSDYHYFGLTQMAHQWTPFLDNRFIDLACSMPIRYHLRRDVVNAALSALSPTLANIPHAETGVRPTSQFPFDLAKKYGSLFWRKHAVDERSPKPYYSRGPWRDRGVVLRERDFGREVLDRNDALLDALPFLDREAAYACYDAHMAGADNTTELYTLFTVLEMPVFEELAGR